MTAWMFAAGLAAVVGLGLAFAPIKTSAESGGFSGRPSHGGFRAPVMPPAGRVALPAVSKGLAAPMHGIAPQNHRRAAGFGVTGGWGGYGAYYDPSNQVLVLDQPTQSAQPVPSYPAASGHQSVTIRVVPAIYDYRLGCQSQTQNVTGGAGGERTITIVRC